MFSWLKSHWILYCAYLSAPILFHSSRDGFVMNMYHTTLEMVDAYGTLVLVFLFVGAIVYYRNTLFRVFLYSTTLSTKAGRKYLWKDTKWVLTTIINRSKFLSTIVSSYRTLKLNVSPLFKKIKSNIKNKK